MLVVSAVMAGGAVQHFELRAQLPKGYKDATGGVYDTVAEYIQRTVPQSTPGTARADRGSTDTDERPDADTDIDTNIGANKHRQQTHAQTQQTQILAQT